MKKILILTAVMLVLVLALGIFAACNPSDDGGGEQPSAEVTVTFDMSGVGENVVKTGKAGEALEAPAAQDTQSYYFGGWHLRADFSDEAVQIATFPEKDATYYAEWDVGYVFKALLEQADGTFEADAAYDVKGRVPKGTTDSVTLSAAELPVINGYSLEKQSYTATFEQGKKDVECEVKYLLAPLKVTYVTGIGEDIVKDVKYGALALGEDALGEFAGRRFIGWAKTDGGDVVLNGGDAIEQSGELTLYAVWEIGLVDLLGGEDCLYISKEEEGVVYLERYAQEETLKGTFSGSSFSVKVTDSFTLDGAILESGFYYFKDTLEKTYTNVEDASETLEFTEGGKGKAIFSSSEGRTEGRYEYDPESAAYVFVSASGGATFEFKLLFEDGSYGFRRADEDIKGSYILRMASEEISYLVFDLDGFGGVEAHFEGTYLSGTYEWDETEQVYRVIIEDGEFVMKATAEEAGNEVDGSTLKGSFIQRDGLEGSYGPAIDGKVQKDKNAQDDLILDGFGKGTYKGEEIEYELSGVSWYEESAYDDEYYGVGSLYRVTFTYGGKEMTLCIEDSQSYNENFYIPAVGKYEMEFFADLSGLGSIYGGNGYEDYDNTLGVFVYKYGKKEGAIVTVYSMYVGSVTGTTVLSEVDWGVITTDDNITYHYVSTYDYFGDKNDADFYFRYDENNDILPQMYKTDLKVSDELSLDIFGYVKYNGVTGAKDINYTYDPGVVASFITFSEVPDKSGNGTHTEVYRVNFDDDNNIAGFDYLPDFHMITDTSNGCSIATLPTDEPNVFEAYIGFPQDYQYYYIIKGTATLLEGTAGEKDARYSFAIDPATEKETTLFLEAQGEEVMEIMLEYYSFKYFVTNKDRGECKLVEDAFEITNKAGETLKLDDKGLMTLTRGGKSESTENFYYIMDDMLVLYVIRGGVRYDIYVSVTFDANGAINDFTVGGDEANRYYPESSLGSGLEEYSRVFILFGGGRGVMTNAGMAVEATYKKTDKTFEWNGFSYAEYEIGICYDSQDDIPDIFYYIAVATEDFNFEDGSRWHGGKYKEKTFSEGEFEIVGGGSVSCNGYDRATYTNAAGETYEAAMHYVDVFDRYFDAATYPDYPEDDGPTDHIYIAYYGEDDKLIDALIFDVTDDGKLDERDGFNGVFAEVVNNAPSQDERYIYLDGQGNVIVYDGDDNETERGKYRLATELGENYLEYTPDDEKTSAVGSFVFWLYRMDGISCYVKFTADNKGVFYGENGELLITDGFAEATHRDKYGVVSNGLCTFLTKNIVEFTQFGQTSGIYLNIDRKSDSFKLCNDDVLTDGDVLYRYIGSEKNYTVDPEIREIAPKAFYYSGVVSVDLAGVTKIGQQAFEYCESLESVKANNVKTIGRYAFAGCYALTKIELPLAETIGDGAFEDAPLSSVKLNGVKEIGQYAFSHENSVMTVFDLTECTTLGTLVAGDDAFRSRVDGAFGVTVINMKAYVRDVEALNTLIRNANASEIIKNTAGLHIADDPMNGAVYIGFTNRSVYVFDGGTLVMRQNGSSKIFGVYVKGDAEGVDVYVRGDSGFEKSLESVKGENTLTIDSADEILFKNAAEHKLISADGHTITFSFSADSNALFASVNVTATFDSQPAVTSTLSATNGTMRLAIGEDDTQYYDVKVLSATTCEVATLGNMIKIATKDDLYQFTGFVKDGKITELLSFGYHAGDSTDPNDETITTPNYSNRTIENLVIDENGEATFDWWYYSDEYVTFTVKYIAKDNTIEASPIKWTIVEGHLSGNGTGIMTFSFDLKELRVDPKSISYFAYTSKTGIMAEPAEEKIISVTEKEHHMETSQFDEPAGVTVLEIETENGKYTVTVKAVRNPEGSGGLTTYSATCTVEKTE